MSRLLTLRGQTFMRGGSPICLEGKMQKSFKGGWRGSDQKPADRFDRALTETRGEESKKGGHQWDQGILSVANEKSSFVDHAGRAV